MDRVRELLQRHRLLTISMLSNELDISSENRDTRFGKIETLLNIGLLNCRFLRIPKTFRTPDFFPFSKLKEVMKGKTTTGFALIQAATTLEL